MESEHSKKETKEALERVNRWKARAVAREKRFREAAVWEMTRGNRCSTTRDEVIARVFEFKGIVDRGEATLEELESWIFGARTWSNPDYRPKVMKFLDVDPLSGG